MSSASEELWLLSMLACLTRRTRLAIAPAQAFDVHSASEVTSEEESDAFSGVDWTCAVEAAAAAEDASAPVMHAPCEDTSAHSMSRSVASTHACMSAHVGATCSQDTAGLFD